jgi:hypothetical protein
VDTASWSTDPVWAQLASSSGTTHTTTTAFTALMR